MHPMVSRSLAGFAPISLQDLDARAAMLERLDRKYIVTAARLRPALDAFKDMFDVLEIDGRRAFTYATRYFDDKDRYSYYAHHQGRRKRCKVRIRNYVDAGASYFEVKLKDRRKITVKRRLKVESGLARLDRTCLDFIETCHEELYGEPFGLPLRQVIEMRYERITLVAREGGERMTIDAGLGFRDGTASRDVPPGLFIIETKSAHGNGAADKVLRSLHLHPTPRCSKYCIGMAALGQVRRRNNFLPALRRLNLAGGDLSRRAGQIRAGAD